MWTCGQTYIGKTERILAQRIKEHNNPNSKSAIQSHKIKYPDHIIDARNIEIIDRADSDYKLGMKEMMHISKQQPELNEQHAASYKNNYNKEMFKSKLNTLIIAYQ